jgi:hypothetical protein
VDQFEMRPNWSGSFLCVLPNQFHDFAEFPNVVCNSGFHSRCDPDATVIEFIVGGHGLTAGEHHFDVKKNEYVIGYREILDSWLRLHGSRALQ